MVIGFRSWCIVMTAGLLLSGVEAAEIRFSDQIEIGRPDRQRFARAITLFKQGDDRYLVAWISLDPQILELVLNPDAISDLEKANQAQRLEETFDVLSMDLVRLGHIVLPKSGKIIRGASMYVKIDETAFRELDKNKLVTDILINIDSQ